MGSARQNQKCILIFIVICIFGYLIFSTYFARTISLRKCHSTVRWGDLQPKVYMFRPLLFSSKCMVALKCGTNVLVTSWSFIRLSAKAVACFSENLEWISTIFSLFSISLTPFFLSLPACCLYFILVENRDWD